MADEITPALSAEEWRLLQLWKAGKMPGGKVRGMVVLDLPESHVHGAAACALYGEPFGFTQRMVDLLHWTADNWQRTPLAKGGFGALNEPDPSDELRALAFRIAALLPPEVEK